MKRVPTIIEYIYRQRIKRASGLLTYKQAFINNYKYAEFNEEPPILAHFVPTGADGMPLEKPIAKDITNVSEDVAECMINKHELLEIEYQEAEKNVRWIGWEWKQRPGYSTLQKIGEDEPIAECYDDSKEMDWYGHNTYGKLITDIPLEPKREFGETLKLK